MLGRKNLTIYGTPYLTDFIGNIEFRISPMSFYQVNKRQTKKLYSIAKEYAGLTGHETVLDMYCGIGTIGLFMADKAKIVVGVETVPEAVKDAKINAEINGITNCEYYAGKAEVLINTIIKNKYKPDVAILDPPRKGCDRKLLDTLSSIKSIKKIVYISCKPSTLARDLEHLKTLNFYPQKITPVDMFPRTPHVETVVLLSKGEIDSKKVRVEFSLEDMDMSGFQKGATYEQIKAYVLEHTGLKVSSLYISQIKRKCGLDVGQNYNLSKKEDAKVPQCPPEKEAAITEALKFFEMI